MKKYKELIHEDYMISLMFGRQDGIVSTTGIVVGISIGVDNKAIVILAAFVAVTIEATSMAAGQYSSEKTVHQMDKTGKHTDSLIVGALIMLVAYLVGGMFSIIPTVIFDQPLARIIAVISAFSGLFIIGYLKGLLIEGSTLRSAIELLIIGGIATSIGLAVGILLKV